MIEISALSTTYGTVPMLCDINLRIADGEIVCVLGPNGAGKTTLFKTIAGLIQPTSGTMRVMNVDVRKYGVERIPALGVGYVPEGRRLFPGLTVRENIRLGYDAIQRDASELDERLKFIAQIFPRVNERLDQVAGTLSGGEQAMVALARALIGRPKLMVMDEPSLGLSPKLIRDYFETIRLIHSQGTTVLLIEQNAEMALRVADRGYILSRGRIVASDRADALRASSVVRNLYFS